MALSKVKTQSITKKRNSRSYSVDRRKRREPHEKDFSSILYADIKETHWLYISVGQIRGWMGHSILLNYTTRGGTSITQKGFLHFLPKCIYTYYHIFCRIRWFFVVELTIVLQNFQQKIMKKNSTHDLPLKENFKADFWSRKIKLWKSNFGYYYHPFRNYQSKNEHTM